MKKMNAEIRASTIPMVHLEAQGQKGPESVQFQGLTGPALLSNESMSTRRRKNSEK
jgi:hypothetical protein